MSNEPGVNEGMSRRTVLKAGAVAAGALLTSTAATASGHGGTGGTETERTAVDSPAGFSVEVLAPHATFPDDVAARFRINYEEGTGSVVSNLPRDASSVLVARATWEPEGTSGWHTHPGPVVVSVVEGEVELVNERDCVARTYAAGEAFIDPGQGSVHVASNPSETDDAVAFATFLGVPDGAPATVWVEPVNCRTVGHQFV